MRNYLLLILAGSLVTGVFSSCKKFLNQEPKYMLTPENAVIDQNSAQAVLNGAYSWINTNDFTVRFTSGFSSMAGIANASSAAFNFNMSATGDNQTLWLAFYKGINAANAAIDAINSLPESAFKDPARKNQMLGEAYGIRAFTHLYTFWYFGQWWQDPTNEYGIIFRDKLATLDGVYQDRLNVGDSYTKIIADFDYAIENAPNYSTGKRVSKQMAKAMKAKLLLNRGRGEDYTEALKLVTSVLDEATAVNLILEPSLTELYTKSWDSKELLFCRYREITDDVVAAYNYTYGYNYATLLIQPLGHNYLNGDPRYDEAWGDVKSPVTNNNTMYRAPKKLARSGRQVGGDNDKYTTYFLRLTELYFMKAELLEKTGKPISEAMGWINAIRDRSELTPLTAANKQEFYEHLFKELLIELHLENDADWMATLRIKDALGNRLITSLRPTISIDENRFIYPIPSSEMKYNINLHQNPGYEQLVY